MFQIVTYTLQSFVAQEPYIFRLPLDIRSGPSQREQQALLMHLTDKRVMKLSMHRPTEQSWYFVTAKPMSYATMSYVSFIS